MGFRWVSRMFSLIGSVTGDHRQPGLGMLQRVTYPLAACSPRPLLPPVTTATLPSRLNIVLKSFSCTSTWADMTNPEIEDLWYGSRSVSPVVPDEEATQGSNGSRS